MKIKLTIFFAALCCILGTKVFAEIEMPTIQGENLFNTTTESIVSGEFTLNPGELINRISSDFMDEIRECGGVLMTLIAISAISAILHVSQTAFGNASSSEAAFFGCFALTSAAAMKCFSIALTYGMDVISSLGDFITKLSPAITVLLIASGHTTSAAAFHPVLSSAVYTAEIICEKCIVPLVVFGAVLSVVNNISGTLQVSNFCKLTNSLSKWILTLTFTLFTGISAIYGFTAPSLDIVGAKAMKFAVGSLVPVVGGFLSDTLETVISGTRLMKNAVGAAGIIVILSICFVPVLKIGVILLLMKLSAAIVEPLTDKRISGVLWDLSSNVTTLFAMVITVTVLFIICISILLSATNGV